jgi:hypothetical protein
MTITVFMERLYLKSSPFFIFYLTLKKDCDILHELLDLTKNI